MSGKKVIRIKNVSGKPTNIIEKERSIYADCKKIEDELPDFLEPYFYYLKSNILPLSRLSYLRDLRFFCNYLSNNDPKSLKIDDFNKLKARDINQYLEYLRNYEVETENGILIYTNENTSLARKRSSLTVFFKFLYREEMVDKNITDSFNPIRVPKPGEREIKALQDDEVMVMIDAVTNGTGLTEHEKKYWNKTKYRDKAILLFFVTYGLRLSELQQLNISSFNFSRGEFLIHRKRAKESVMPLNRTIENALSDYLEKERKAGDDEDALFLSLQSKRMTERQIRELVKKYTSISLKVPRDKGYSPHKLRATAATSLIGRGHSVYDVKTLLDHENVTTTQLYAAQPLNVKRDLIKSFEWDEEE